MKRMNPDYVTFVARHVNSSPYFSLISMDIKALEWGYSHIEVAVQEKHIQPFGMVHGGVCASLVDAAAFWAVFTQIDEQVGLTTVEIKLNYLAPVSEGRLIARGKSIRVGNTLCLGEASIKDEKRKLISHGTSTMMILKDLKIQGGGKIPPKYVDSLS